jgi:periplasmic protein CpxP/Spy
MQTFGTKFIRRTAGMLLCGAAMAVPAIAQQQQDAPPPPPPQQGQWQGPPPGGPGRGGPERRLELLQHRLNLTPDQTTQVKAILADGRAKMQAMRNDEGGGDRREKMRSLMEEENSRIKGVLTGDQKKIFDDMLKEQRDRMRERRDDGGAPPPPPPPQQ